MTKADLDFIQYVKDQCKAHGIKCDLRNTKYVKLSPSIRCSGYFDGDGMTLVVAMGRDDSLAILVHEYGHFTQWLDSLAGKFPLWKASHTPLINLNRWLEGEPVRNMKKHLAVCRDLELDNEKRAVKLCREFNLSIDIPDYIKRANAYVQSYNWIYYTRRWSSPSNSPYKNDIVINAVSDKFNMRYDKMSAKVHKAFKVANI